MFRIFFIGVVLYSFAGERSELTTADIKEPVKKVNTDTQSDIDPIITGITIMDEHKRLWKIQNEKYLECGLCGEEPQAFSGD